LWRVEFTQSTKPSDDSGLSLQISVLPLRLSTRSPHPNRIQIRIHQRFAAFYQFLFNLEKWKPGQAHHEGSVDHQMDCDLRLAAIGFWMKALGSGIGFSLAEVLRDWEPAKRCA